MAARANLTSLAMGNAGAAIVVAVGLAWNASSRGGLVRALGAATPDQLSGQSAVAPPSAAAPGWRPFTGKNGHNPACDYRFHLLIPPEKAAKISLDLSRYTGDASLIYPTVVNRHFLQAAIMEPGEPIAVDISDATGGDCSAGTASLSDLPGMCFETKIEERCR
jgi:hypothetical protein